MWRPGPADDKQNAAGGHPAGDALQRFTTSLRRKHLERVRLEHEVEVAVPGSGCIKEVGRKVLNAGLWESMVAFRNRRWGYVEGDDFAARRRQVLGIITETATYLQAPLPVEVEASALVPLHEVGIREQIGPGDDRTTITSFAIERFEPSKGIAARGVFCAESARTTSIAFSSAHVPPSAA